MAKDVEHFLKCLSPICNSFIENSLFRFEPQFLIVLFGNLISSFFEFFIYFGDQSSLQCGVSEDLFPFSKLPFLS